MNCWEEELDEPIAQHPIAFLGNLEPSDTGLHQVHDVGGYCWKLVSGIVDSGTISSVAPPDVSSVPLTESQSSVNGMQYHTADGTKIPNLGHKTFAAVPEQGSALSQTFQIADISRPLTSVGELADAGNVVVFGRKGDYAQNVDSGRRFDFKREYGVCLLRTGVQERAKLGLGGRVEIDARHWSRRTGNRNELRAFKSD